jgi:hypothetical protein
LLRLQQLQSHLLVARNLFKKTKFSERSLKYWIERQPRLTTNGESQMKLVTTIIFSAFILQFSNPAFAYIPNTTISQNNINEEAIDWNNVPEDEDEGDGAGTALPFYIESDETAAYEDPMILDADADTFVQFWNATIENPDMSTHDLLIYVGGGKVVCAVKTNACEAYPTKNKITIIVNKMGEGSGQNMQVKADGTTLWTTPVSTGKPGYRTPEGTFPLATYNGGRIKTTRNHCSSVKKFGTMIKGVLHLAPMAYSVHFNGGVAMHQGVVNGTPLSHKCVRQPAAAARKLYCLLLANNNWKRATVIVKK